MTAVRLSRSDDVPALRSLWALAFGDSEEYMDNFFRTYYRPERMIVLEEEGVVRAMTAWFDTTFVLPGGGAYRAAYLYAVATHPDCRGRGLAGELLARADAFFRDMGIPAVTTVPARPDLHNFFGANGFRECFVLLERELTRAELPAAETELLFPVTPKEYGALREELLAGIPHIAYPEDALAYQAGCCALSGGGLYAASTPAGAVCLCAEGAGEGLVVVKEILGAAAAKGLALADLARVAPAERWLVREPFSPNENGPAGWKFAMLKWLAPEAEKRWNWEDTAYLGLAFD